MNGLFRWFKYILFNLENFKEGENETDFIDYVPYTTDKEEYLGDPTQMSQTL